MLLKTRFFPEMAAFFKRHYGSFMKIRSLFLSNKQAIFLAVSKFCAEVISQNFAVF